MSPVSRLVLAVAGFAVLLAPTLGLARPAVADVSRLDNAACQSCHDGRKGKLEMVGSNGEMRAVQSVQPGKYAASVHGRLDCVACHLEITDSSTPHRKSTTVRKAECAQCHLDLWEETKKMGKAAERPRLGIVADNVAAYKKSFHAKPDKDDPTKQMAICSDCHNVHTFDVPPRGTTERKEWHLTVADICGRCHEDHREDWSGSAHGKEAAKKNLKTAVCSDCHTTHDIVGTSTDKAKLAITESCGDCHADAEKTYKASYHGQVMSLGYTYTAKCFDCHGSHGIQPSSDPRSKVHEKNRLKTCQKCHSDKKPGMRDATPGFVSFGPHAHGNDYGKYPQMWIATKFMVGLLIFVFAFFWAHSGLWYYREWKDRKTGKPHARIDMRGLKVDEKAQFIERFHWGWRVSHLAFALITMTLVLTGTTALYADSAWAPVVAKAAGGPKVLGLIHRVCAFLFVGIFLVHFIYVTQKLLRSKSFRWFGADSLVPNWKDFADCWSMFKWFVGKGDKPLFDRWTYFEKFDYWAVFWGVNIIGWSGLMLAFPHVTAQFLPGWVFNVATLVHGEEAFLAAVFLFTVHFFNNHFRPDKLPPPDVVMFTGTQSLQEFRHDHPAQYQRLVDSGELERRLVAAPSKPMHVASVVLGLVLIGCGLTLLILIGIGFVGAA